MHIRTTVKNNRSQQDETFAKKQWLENETSFHYANLENRNMELYHLHMKITKGMSNGQFAGFIAFKSHVERVIASKCVKKSKNHAKKLKGMMYNQKSQPKAVTKRKSIPDFVRNLSSQTFSIPETDVLNNGLNYAVNQKPKRSRRRWRISYQGTSTN
jgi:hypothetical protein